MRNFFILVSLGYFLHFKKHVAPFGSNVAYFCILISFVSFALSTMNQNVLFLHLPKSTLDEHSCNDTQRRVRQWQWIGNLPTNVINCAIICNYIMRHKQQPLDGHFRGDDEAKKILCECCSISFSKLPFPEQYFLDATKIKVAKVENKFIFSYYCLAIEYTVLFDTSGIIYYPRKVLSLFRFFFLSFLICK